ncbi:MlaC/ttg2D family ABC transporter substrate-binding protein [Marinospirillum sp.]|uniref:MlaC/ttg2D family ABC transporter substrate-binding protein n=1 Tax=Marinospirillum sp. TaxID=2183934 RepID=UPI003A84D223
MWKQLWKHYAGALLLVFSSSFVQAEALAPYQVVERGVEAITAAFEAQSPYFDTQPERLFEALNGAMEPYVDFRQISLRVMGGRYVQAATPAQRDRFAEVFQDSLVRTFARGLMTFDYREFDLDITPRPPRYEDQDHVDVMVVGQDGQRYPVVFTLRQRDGEWKVINLIVNGVNLGLTLNSQFDRAMREQRRNFDRVIAQWSVEGVIEELEEQMQQP